MVIRTEHPATHEHPKTKINHAANQRSSSEHSMLYSGNVQAQLSFKGEQHAANSRKSNNGLCSKHVLLHARMNQNVLNLQTSQLGMRISTVLLKNEYLTQESVGTSEYGAIPVPQKPIKCVHIFKALSLILVRKSFCVPIQEQQIKQCKVQF